MERFLQGEMGPTNAINDLVIWWHTAIQSTCLSTRAWPLFSPRDDSLSSLFFSFFFLGAVLFCLFLLTIASPCICLHVQARIYHNHMLVVSELSGLSIYHNHKVKHSIVLVFDQKQPSVCLVFKRKKGTLTLCGVARPGPLAQVSILVQILEFRSNKGPVFYFSPHRSSPPKQSDFLVWQRKNEIHD